jgi:hypothetical protein
MLLQAKLGGGDKATSQYHEKEVAVAMPAPIVDGDGFHAEIDCGKRRLGRQTGLTQPRRPAAGELWRMLQDAMPFHKRPRGIRFQAAVCSGIRRMDCEKV